MKSVASKGTDSSLETMLINYSKRISEKENVIRERDTNRKLIAELSELGEMSDDLYAADEVLSKSIAEACGFKASVGKNMAAIDEGISEISSGIQSIEAKIMHIEHEERSKEYYEAGDEYEAAHKAFLEAKEALEQAREESWIKKHDEDILQSAKLYEQIARAESQITAYKKLIEEKENDSEDAENVAKLKFSCLVKAKSESEALALDITDSDNLIRQKADELQDSMVQMAKAEKLKNEAKEKHGQITANLNALKENTDARIKALRIEAVRMLDGFYAEKEIDAEKKRRADSRDKAVSSIEKIRDEIKSNENKKNKIPGELADAKIEIDRLLTDKKTAEDALLEYEKLLDSLEHVCNKYSLEAGAVFSGRLKSVLKEEAEMTIASIRKHQQDKQSLEERLKSAKEGHVHILPDIMKYIISTGIGCRTGEEYMTGLLDSGAITHEKAEDIMERHPEFAFSLLLDNEKDLNKLLSAGNVEWLAASVPLYTMEQVNAIMSGGMESAAHLAAFDRHYFADRSGYYDRLEKEISTKDESGKRLEERLCEIEEENKLVERFEYPEDWKDLQENLIEELQEKIALQERKKKELEEEQVRIQKQLDSLKEDLETEDNLLRELSRWLESYEELGDMLIKETEWYNKGQEAYIVLKNAEEAYKKVSDAVTKCREEQLMLESRRRQQADHLEQVRTVIEKVDNAVETETVEGSLDELYSQYLTLLGSLSESLDNLRASLDRAQLDKTAYEKELEDYECERSEYDSVRFSPEALKEAKDAVKSASQKTEAAQLKYSDQNAKEASARLRYDTAVKGLEDYGNEALPQNEIGENFKARIASAGQEIKQQNEKKDVLGNERRLLERIYDGVSIVLKPFLPGDVIKPVDLSEKPDLQWDVIHDNLIRAEKSFRDQKEKLKSGIKTTVAGYKDIAVSEIVNKLDAIGKMLDDTDIKGDRLYTVSESISTMTASIEKINSRIETDLKEIENDFNDIVDQCMNQGKRMYLDLRMIAASSKAHIFEGKPQTQMLKMDLPEEKEISEEASRVSVKTEIEQGANEIKELLRSGADEKMIRKRARVIVSSERLLHKYIRQESVKIKVYKIDMNSANSVYKGWEETLTQSSGAEKFVVFFAVVLTLMNYTRSSAGLVSRNARSVLILDNPFGKITSAHLLKPMFDIAKHFNVQLICLSDINKSDVIGCFDCVIKLVIKTQSLSDFEILTHEGNERIEHGYYKIMNRQMSLF